MNTVTPKCCFVLSLAVLSTLSACGNSDRSNEQAQSAAAALQVTIHERTLEAAINQVIQPGYRALANQADHLSATAQSFCDDRSISRFEALQGQWRSAMSAWQQMAWLSQGPIAIAHRFDRLEGWPRATPVAVKNRIEQLLDPNSDQSINLALVEKQPVQAQGLPALEYLLFGQRSATDFPANDSGDRRCDLLTSIALNIATMSTAVSDNWINPGARDAIGRGMLASPGTDVSAVFNVLSNQIMVVLSNLRNDKLGGPLGITAPESTVTPNPLALESGRSETSINHVQDTIEAVRAISKSEGGRMSDALAELGHQGVNERLQLLINEASDAAQVMTNQQQSLALAMTEPSALENAIALHSAVRVLDEYWRATVMPATGAKPSFNFNDGD